MESLLSLLHAIDPYLLMIHIICGTIALISAGLSLVVKKGAKWHLFFGNIFFWMMFGIFLTAIPMSAISKNIFLFVVAIFSFYLAFSGRQFAKNKKGIPMPIDWVAVSLMLLSGTLMSAFGVLGLFSTFGVSLVTQFLSDIGIKPMATKVMLGFGPLALTLGIADLRSFVNKAARGKKRIAKHLTNMLGGTIAVITAFLVVNLDFEPKWVVWLLPTVVITPVIFWWNFKVLR